MQLGRLGSIPMRKSSTRCARSSRLGTAPLLVEVIDKADDLPESLEVQQGEGVTGGRLGGGLLPASIRPAHGNRRMRAIAQAHNEVWINTPADADDLTLLAIEGVMGMGDGHSIMYPENWTGD